MALFLFKNFKEYLKLQKVFLGTSGYTSNIFFLITYGILLIMDSILYSKLQISLVKVNLKY
jgi:hypothetical protein